MSIRAVLLAGPLACALAASLAGAQSVPPDVRRSSLEGMAASTQAMQRDDTLNPAMLWAGEGEALWNRPPAPGAPACSDCHQDARQSMRGVAVRYPSIDERTGQATNLSGRINFCRQRHQSQPPLAWAADPLLALEAWVALQSRGLPLAPSRDARLTPALARGQAFWTRRIGQLNLSCAQCHDERAGASLGGTGIPQGHPTAYPIYRLEWQTLGNLQRRLRGCLSGVRAELPAPGSPALLDLEVFLANRAAGMPSESPGVRP